jgi:hypothetical protein
MAAFLKKLEIEVDFIGFDKDFDVSLAALTTLQGHMMDSDTIPKEVNLYGKQTLKVHFKL